MPRKHINVKLLRFTASGLFFLYRSRGLTKTTRKNQSTRPQTRSWAVFSCRSNAYSWLGLPGMALAGESQPQMGQLGMELWRARARALLGCIWAGVAPTPGSGAEIKYLLYMGHVCATSPSPTNWIGMVFVYIPVPLSNAPECFNGLRRIIKLATSFSQPCQCQLDSSHSVVCVCVKVLASLDAAVPKPIQ